MGAPHGNNNAIKGKRWSAAIDRALESKSKAEGIQALDKLAEKLIEAAEAGEQWALKELGDRLEGRPAQTTVIQGDEDNPLQAKVSVEFVN